MDYWTYQGYQPGVILVYQEVVEPGYTYPGISRPKLPELPGIHGLTELSARRVQEQGYPGF